MSGEANSPPISGFICARGNNLYFFFPDEVQFRKMYFLHWILMVSFGLIGCSEPTIHCHLRDHSILVVRFVATSLLRIYPP